MHTHTHTHTRMQRKTGWIQEEYGTSQKKYRQKKAEKGKRNRGESQRCCMMCWNGKRLAASVMKPTNVDVNTKRLLHQIPRVTPFLSVCLLSFLSLTRSFSSFFSLSLSLFRSILFISFSCCISFLLHLLFVNYIKSPSFIYTFR